MAACKESTCSVRDSPRLVACEHALLFGQARSCETCFTRLNRRACLQATGLVDFAIVLVNYSASEILC